MSKVNIKIEGIPYEVDAGLTILEACKQCGYDIPTLCTFNHGECNQGSCRVCLVEATGARGLVASCVYPINEGMEITISSPKAVAARRASVELILSNHNRNCQECDKNEYCELLDVARRVGARDNKFDGAKSPVTVDQLTPTIVRDTSKCVLCGRCVERCKSAHGIGVLGFENRGFNAMVAPAENRPFIKSPCIMCGQCINVCPTGALMEKSEIAKVDEAMAAGKYVIAQTAPAVRAALGESFGMPVGTPVTGKMVAALRRLGYKKVFDTDFAADLTIMEEGTEFLSRFKNKEALKKEGKYPLITSCSPAWIKFCEHNFPEQLGHLSSCKSPQQMFGAVCKTYYAEKLGMDPKDIVVVSIMPCTAKKFEKGRPNQAAAGVPDIDYALTTRELAKLIKRAGILFNDLEPSTFDAPLGIFTGAGLIFGVTGGVMEAALRTVYEIVVGKEAPSLDFVDVRGTQGIKEASYDLNGVKVKVAVASGLANARKIMDDIKAGKSDYDFIEIMSCPGGCVNGGGQPIKTAYERNNFDIKAIRAASIYAQDKNLEMRKSHVNPAVQTLYKEYFGEPNSHKAHEILHTKYVKRDLH